MPSIKSLERKAEENESGIQGVLQEEGVTAAPDNYGRIPDYRRSFLLAVATIIIPNDWRNYGCNYEDMPLAFGRLANNGTLTPIGGGLTCKQEEDVGKMYANDPGQVDKRLLEEGKLPEDLFFRLLGLEALHKGKFFRPIYMEIHSGVEALLERDLRREIEEETGKATSPLITLEGTLPLAPKKTQLRALRLGNMNADIVNKINEEGVRLTEDEKRLLGFLLEVRELGMLGTADLEELIACAEKTEEVRGMVKITIGELLARGEEAISNGREGWNEWDVKKQGERPRNDSVYYYLRGLLKYIKQNAYKRAA